MTDHNNNNNNNNFLYYDVQFWTKTESVPSGDCMVTSSMKGPRCKYMKEPQGYVLDAFSVLYYLIYTQHNLVCWSSLLFDVCEEVNVKRVRIAVHERVDKLFRLPCILQLGYSLILCSCVE
jgi:hypothetical protein